MTQTLIVLALALSPAPATATSAPATATSADAPAVAAPAAKFSVDDTELGTLLDNPAAKAVLVKYINAIVSNPRINMARSMTLKQLQQFAGDSLTDAKLAMIQADLDKLPAK